MIKSILLFVLLTVVGLNASTIQEDILKLRSAPKEERYKIMNMIKLKLSKMNAHQRSQAIQKLFKAIKHKNNSHQLNTQIMKSNKFKHIKKPIQDFKIHENQNFQNHLIKKDSNFHKKNKNNINNFNKNSKFMKNGQGHR